MRKCLLVLLVLLIVAPLAVVQEKKKRKRRKPRPTVTFVSPVQCKGDHGKWRWKVKTEKDRPPARIAADPRVTAADIAAWEPPEGKITTRTPRVGREQTRKPARTGKALTKRLKGTSWPMSMAKAATLIFTLSGIRSLRW
jgi:hypothetical protein